jgi:predicted phage terminase large subunit-like protein
VKTALHRAADLLDPPTLDVPQASGWCAKNLSEWFPLAMGPHHVWLLDKTTGPKPSGVRAFEGAARGSGKTTAALGKATHATAHGTHRFVVVVAKNDGEAEARVKIIRRVLETRDDLISSYPSLKILRARDDELSLRGGRIVGKGAGAALRGLVRETRRGEVERPDLVILDDVEEEEQVRSRLRTDRLEEWLFAEIGQLGGPGDETGLDVVGVGTTMGMDALATRALEKKGRFAGWRTAKFPAEIGQDGARAAGWPEGQSLKYLSRLITPGDELFVGGTTYAQEYLLDPQSREDTVFQKPWLRHGIPPRRGMRYLSLGLDPAASEKSSADFSAAVLAGIDEQWRVWILWAWHDRVSSKRLFDMVEAEKNRWGFSVGYEGVSGFLWGVQELRRRRIPHRAIQPQTDKISRAQPISLMYEQEWVWHDIRLRDSDLEYELLAFPTGPHDDLVDALVMAVKLATNNGLRVKGRQSQRREKKRWRGR